MPSSTAANPKTRHLARVTKLLLDGPRSSNFEHSGHGNNTRSSSSRKPSLCRTSQTQLTSHLGNSWCSMAVGRQRSLAEVRGRQHQRLQASPPQNISERNVDQVVLTIPQRPSRNERGRPRHTSRRARLSECRRSSAKIVEVPTPRSRRVPTKLRKPRSRNPMVPPTRD